MKENEPKNRKPKEHEREGPEAEEVRGTVAHRTQYGTSIGVAMLGSTKESLTLIAPAPHRPTKPRAHEKREGEHEEED